MYAFRVLPGQDLKTEIEKKVNENGWKAVSIVTCVGSLNSSTIRFANQKDATKISGKLEIVSLTGTLSQAGCHLHIAVSDTTGKTIGGHLMAGSLIYTTAEIVLAILKDYSFEREVDTTFGYKELVIKPIE
jgi:predicted DNA-binding protein with PD1-like motif